MPRSMSACWAVAPSVPALAPAAAVRVAIQSWAASAGLPGASR